MNIFKKKYIAYSVILSATFWIFESVVHAYAFHHEPFSLFPHEAHEVWMRSLIFILIIVYGFFIQKSVEKERQLETEKMEIYIEMIRANNHILNNFLQNMYIFKLEADQSEDFDKEVLQLYHQIIQDTKQAIQRLEGLDKPSKAGIEEKYNPV
jgi:hypothetical protein